MADNFAAKFNEIQKSPGSQKKALVIMNYRHAFTHFRLERGGKVKNIENMTGFLLAAYPGKVANVMINGTGLIIGSRDNPAGATAIQNGKWDAAFIVAGNPDRGFDFKGSPVRRRPIRLFPLPHSCQLHVPGRLHGFRLLQAARASTGCPSELPACSIRRSRPSWSAAARSPAARDPSKSSRKQVQQWVATVRVSGYDNKEIFPKNECPEKIQQWLKKAN